MLNDYVYETLVARDNGKLGKIFPWVSYTALTLFIIIFNILTLVLFGNFIYISGMISFGIWYLVYRANKNMHIEHELSICNDSVTGDKFNDHLIESDDIINGTEYSPFTTDDPNVWYCFVSQMGMKYIMLFNFKPEMYSNFRRYNPRNTEPYVMPQEEEA